MEDSQLPYVPDEILCKLPVNSIIRFKTTSKSWLDLVSNRHFEHAHLQNFCDRLLANGPYGACDRNLEMLSQLSSVNFAVLASPKIDRWKIVGCCHGLICIDASKGRHIIWNPSTRQYRDLPLSGYPFHPNADDHITIRYENHGFGYDAVKDEYKVVQNIWTVESGNLLKIYSSRSKLWRNGSWPGGEIKRSSSGVFWKGCIHWLVILGATEWRLVVQDMSSENFTNLVLPNPTIPSLFPTLGTTESRLWVSYSSVRNLDIWMLGEGQWKKFVHIRHTYPEDYRCCVPRTVLISDSGCVLVQKDEDPMSELHTNSELVEVYSVPKELGVVLYTESLFSPSLGQEEHSSEAGNKE